MQLLIINVALQAVVELQRIFSQCKIDWSEVDGDFFSFVSSELREPEHRSVEIFPIKSMKQSQIIKAFDVDSLMSIIHPHYYRHKPNRKIDFAPLVVSFLKLPKFSSLLKKFPLHPKLLANLAKHRRAKISRKLHRTQLDAAKSSKSQLPSVSIVSIKLWVFLARD